MNERNFVGLDVNRNGIHAVVRPSGEKWATSIDDSGISETAERLTAVHPDVVVMEAYGGLELPIAERFPPGARRRRGDDAGRRRSQERVRVHGIGRN